MGMKLKKNQDSSFIEICTVLRMAWAKKNIPITSSYGTIQKFNKPTFAIQEVSL